MPGHGRPQAATRLTEAIDPSEQDDDRLGPRYQPSTPALARSSRAVARSMRRAAALDEHELSGGARASSSARIHTIYRAHSYRIPGQRHPTIVAASFLLKETPGGAVIDLMSSHPTLCGRILSRFEEEVATLKGRGRLKAPESVRRLAVKKARFYLCDRRLHSASEPKCRPWRQRRAIEPSLGARHAESAQAAVSLRTRSALGAA